MAELDLPAYLPRLGAGRWQAMAELDLPAYLPRLGAGWAERAAA